MNQNQQINKLEKDILEIKLRNSKVEKEKAWEISLTRKVFVSITTYIFMAVFMYSIDVEKPYINALVPTAGYLLSTLSLGFVKKIWERKRL